MNEKLNRFSRRVRAARPILIFVGVGVLSSLLCICVPVTPTAAQPIGNASSARRAPTDPQLDTNALVLQLDRLLDEGRREEADAVYQQLLASRADAVATGLELVSQRHTYSQLTVRYVCALAADDVPAELSQSVLAYVLPAPLLDDWTKMYCIDTLADRVDVSFRQTLLQFAVDPELDPNLRISALKVASSKWPQDSRPTLVQLLRTAQEPIMHHKAQQYLARSGFADALSFIEEFVVNRDPATLGSALSKEYGLLVLRAGLGDEVLPLLATILRDESWPTEIQDRAIDLLARSGLSGGEAILSEARDRADAGLRSRIDTALSARE